MGVGAGISVTLHASVNGRASGHRGETFMRRNLADGWGVFPGKSRPIWAAGLNLLHDRGPDVKVNPPRPLLQTPLRTRLHPPIRRGALCWIVNQSQWVLEINQVSNASPASCIVSAVLSSSDSCHASGIRWTKTDDNQRRISQPQNSQTSGKDGEQVSCTAAASGCWFIFTLPFQK